MYSTVINVYSITRIITYVQILLAMYVYYIQYLKEIGYVIKTFSVRSQKFMGIVTCAHLRAMRCTGKKLLQDSEALSHTVAAAPNQSNFLCNSFHLT